MLLLALSAAWASPRVIVITSDDLSSYTDPVPAFVEALGEPCTVVDLHGRRDEGEALIARLEKERPAAVFALGAKAAWVAEQADAPTVYAQVLDPGRYGLDGQRMTEIVPTVRPVHFLSQVSSFLPDVERIAVIRGADDPRDAEEWRRAAMDTGIDLSLVPIESPRRLRGALDAVADDVDAVWVLPDREVIDTDAFRMLVDETRRRRLPLLVGSENMVRAGGLFATVPDPSGVGVQAAGIVRGIIDGSPPEANRYYPDQFRVALNVTTLDLVRVSFDRHLLDFVDVVVE